jgi:hypothetical protein
LDFDRRSGSAPVERKGGSGALIVSSSGETVPTSPRTSRQISCDISATLASPARVPKDQREPSKGGGEEDVNRVIDREIL